MKEEKKFCRKTLTREEFFFKCTTKEDIAQYRLYPLKLCNTQAQIKIKLGNAFYSVSLFSLCFALLCFTLRCAQFILTGVVVVPPLFSCSYYNYNHGVKKENSSTSRVAVSIIKAKYKTRTKKLLILYFTQMIKVFLSLHWHDLFKSSFLHYLFFVHLLKW